MAYSVLGGGAMLGAIFMATDYATSPALPKAQIVYGIGCGALTVLFRTFGNFPEGVTYAILLMNACAWALDKALPVRRFGVMTRRRWEMNAKNFSSPSLSFSPRQSSSSPPAPASPAPPTPRRPRP